MRGGGFGLASQLGNRSTCAGQVVHSAARVPYAAHRSLADRTRPPARPPAAQPPPRRGPQSFANSSAPPQCGKAAERNWPNLAGSGMARTQPSPAGPSRRCVRERIDSGELGETLAARQQQLGERLPVCGARPPPSPRRCPALMHASSVGTRLPTASENDPGTYCAVLTDRCWRRCIVTRWVVWNSCCSLGERWLALRRLPPTNTLSWPASG